jgi:hypothetical protein
MKRLLLLILLSGFLFIPSVAQIDFTNFRLVEEISNPLLIKVFPSVKFYSAIRGLDHLVIIGEIENKKFLLDEFSSFQFNKLYKEVKDKSNCSIKEKLETLIFLRTYIKENYKIGDSYYSKYEENKFKIDTIYEKSQQIRGIPYQWYAKCKSQDGYFEMYFYLLQQEVNAYYLTYNGNPNGITYSISFFKIEISELVFPFCTSSGIFATNTGRDYRYFGSWRIEAKNF